ncbi:uncharacterized protein EV420DRAFT_1474669 [Desarmillaria tabescens]|uniref:Uncharacterized protein n=1 Tax=Armillaria tabescens TaxID=1929756 RepID=A0AA39T691_ARMTA|nr:uncharacterized protein EV420DRAFT_1474669 [Desarmillaria tabescens]KAK0467351.1 hypothetical protein EV420DRAFT_1474669 [Desarmillaria tabescens]
MITTPFEFNKTKQLLQLQNALFHPDITNQDLFHAILLTANHALQLETDEFPDYRLQCTFAFNTMLAELQGSDDIPILSTVGYAAIMFYPGEYEHKHKKLSSQQHIKFHTARLGEEITMHAGMPCPRLGSNMSTPISSTSESSEDSVEAPIIPSHERNNPYKFNSLASAPAMVRSIQPMLAYSIIKDVELTEKEDSQGWIACTLICRITSGSDQPVSPTGFQAQPENSLLYFLLPPMFMAIMAKLIETKYDKAQHAFLILEDYNLTMRIDKGHLSQIIRDLTRPMTMQYNYAARTLYRVANKKGCTLLLHHPIFLQAIHDTIFLCKAFPAKFSQVSMYDMPHFPASLFMLEDIEDEEFINTSPFSDSPPLLIDFSSLDDEEEEMFWSQQKLIMYPMMTGKDEAIKGNETQSPQSARLMGRWISPSQANMALTPDLDHVK